MNVEILKLRRTHILLLGGALSLGIVLFASMNLFADGQVDTFVADPAGAWSGQLIGVAMSLAFLTPLQMALLASRAVDNEHASGGWLLNAVAGTRQGSLLRRKLRVLAPLVTALKLLEFGGCVAFPVMLGAPLPSGSTATAWMLYGFAAVVTSVALACAMLVLAAVSESQIGVLACGVVGGFCGIVSLLSPAWLAAINPFGYFAVLLPYTFADAGPVPAQPGWALWCVYVALLGAGFFASTRALNRKEI